MKGLCPNCEKETALELIKEMEVLEVRGEAINVDVEYFKCIECSEDFENTRGYDALDVAYREYRRSHDMLQPEEIRDWRKGYGLTQKDLSSLLGWGGATLSRYENGALQVDAHEKILRLIQEPSNLHKLILEAPGVLSEEKQNRLISELQAAEDEVYSFELLFEERFGRYDADIYSGFKKFSLGKLFNTILFFCDEGQLITKLNKLLFYADFKHFKEYTVSITGTHYVHLPHGPVPDKYNFYYADLVNERRLEVQEMLIGNYYAENYVTQISPDLSIFDDSELKTLIFIKEYFNDFNSTDIRNFSHEEQPYVETNDSETIAYSYASELQL